MCPTAATARRRRQSLQHCPTRVCSPPETASRTSDTRGGAWCCSPPNTAQCRLIERLPSIVGERNICRPISRRAGQTPRRPSPTACRSPFNDVGLGLIPSSPACPWSGTQGNEKRYFQNSPWQKAPLHSTGDASRLTVLFLGRIWPICSLVTDVFKPCAAFNRASAQQSSTAPPRLPSPPRDTTAPPPAPAYPATVHDCKPIGPDDL